MLNENVTFHKLNNIPLVRQDDNFCLQLHVKILMPILDICSTCCVLGLPPVSCMN